MTSDEADILIRKQPVPDAIVSTGARRLAGNWNDGGARDLADNCWLLRTGGANAKKSASGTVNFDAAVDVGGVTLADDACAQDNLTKKIIVLGWLTGAGARRRLSGRRIEILAHAYDWLVRHRRSILVETFAAWRPADMEDLFTRLAAGPVCELVPIARRIDAVADQRHG